MNNRSPLMYFAIGAVLGIFLATVLDNAVLGVVVGLGVAAGGYFWQQRQGGGMPSFGGGKRGGGNAYKQLLAKARGDVSLAKRLMAYEEKRNPNGTQAEWAADALDRWNRDRA